MTKEEGLEKLKLPPTASKEEIERAYQKLVKRYPPEFHPDKFREIDEAYSYLTSFSAMINNLLSSNSDESTLERYMPSFSIDSPTAETVDKALEDIKIILKTDILFT